MFEELALLMSLLCPEGEANKGSADFWRCVDWQCFRDWTKPPNEWVSTSEVFKLRNLEVEVDV